MNDMQFLQRSLADKSVFPFVVVEDDNLLGLTLKKYLERTFQTDVYLYNTAEDCIVEFAKNHRPEQPFLLLADISLGQGSDGLYLIDLLKERGFQFLSLVMTGYASIETAISATRRGAYHYLTKPFELSSLSDLVIRGFKETFQLTIPSHSTPQAHQPAQALMTDISTQSPPSALSKDLGTKKRAVLEAPLSQDKFMGMIGRSKAMKEVFEKIRKVAQSHSTVLIQGQSGVGKDLVSAAIHRLSSRKDFPRVSVSCSAIPAELIESELFGHIKGAFAGAISNRKGRYELAHQGTLILDDIAYLPSLLQLKLIKALQLKQIEPVGSTEAIHVDTRLVVTTECDIESLVREGKFREDLYYRLNVLPIRIPTLKERKEDIPLLIQWFIERFSSADHSNRISFAQETLDLLMNYEWPGNVSELENVIERLVILRGGQDILPEDLPAKIYRTNPLSSNQYKTLFELPLQGVDLKQILSDIEDSLIMQALARTSGNKNQASKLLSLNRTTLIEKMKKKGLEYGEPSEPVESLITTARPLNTNGLSSQVSPSLS